MTRRLVAKVHRSQRLRHITANKLTPALTALRHLQEGKSVSPRLIQRAIQDLEEILRFVDKRVGKKVGKPARGLEPPTRRLRSDCSTN